MDMQTSQVTIRPLKEGDEAVFVAFGQFMTRGYYKNCGFSIPKFLRLFAEIVSGNPSYCGFVAEIDSGEVIGGFVGRVDEYFFSHEKIASDIALMVKPEYRKTHPQTVGYLVERFEEWAKARGAIEVCIGATTGMHGDKYEKFLNSVGYSTVGFITKKRTG